MATVKRYLVERPKSVEEVGAQITAALAGIVGICRQEKIDRVTLVIPKKGGWEFSEVARILGPAATKALLKGKPVSLNSGVTMTLESPSTFRNSASRGLIVGAHISDRDMAMIDDSWDAQAIMFLPWSETEGRAWQATWKPETIGPSTWTAPVSALAAPVEEALEMLTRNINLGSGLGHPSDKALAVKVIGRLRAEGHPLDPVEIKRWALRHAWSSHAASDLEAIAKKRH
jgi:hypothetical protein